MRKTSTVAGMTRDYQGPPRGVQVVCVGEGQGPHRHFPLTMTITVTVAGFSVMFMWLFVCLGAFFPHVLSANSAA